MACGRWGSLPCHSMPSCWGGLPPPKHQPRSVAELRLPVVRPVRFHWPPASFPTCCPPAREFCRRLQPTACLLHATPGRRTCESVVSSFARKCRKVSHARQLERVHHLNDRSERCFPIRLQRQRRLPRLGKIANRALQFVNIDRTAIQLDGIGFVYSDDSVFQFRRRFRRGFRFRQINLHLWLILFECGRDHEKDEQDDEDIDERNDNDGGRATFANREIHVSALRRLTLAFGRSFAPRAMLPLGRGRNNIFRSIPPPAFPSPPTSPLPFSKNS